jgi:hypothetical protein
VCDRSLTAADGAQGRLEPSKMRVLWLANLHQSLTPKQMAGFGELVRADDALVCWHRAAWHARP